MTRIGDALRPHLGVPAKRPGTVRFEVEPHAFEFKQDNTDRLNQLVDKLEAEEAARRVTLRRRPHTLVGRSW